ncbi:hypothetical protein OHC33_001669 [Knufia fluminis]|uniref:Sphingoid long-chain base transporter RSB1 n=1 Tax=Knufia fluminis TaxID=191047 RepID=A0AAN8ERU7_9EURO|nr:hypothetical protein OHC33_001669 [Knufia fluminis]
MSAPYTITSINGDIFVLYPDGTAYTGGGAEDSNCTISVCPVELSVYGYRPTLPGSIALIALYGLCALTQIVLGWRYKTWGFMVAMLFGCADEILGYVGRILYYQNPWGETGFIMQIVLITMGPVFFCAAIYVMIYKIIHYIDPSLARFNPRLIYWIFISCDTLALILQAVGGAMSSTSNGASSAGVNIALAGLAFQVATITVFVAVVADYAVRARHVIAKHGLNLKFKIFASFLGLAILTIFIRCCYRVYELSEGYSRDSEALRDEPLFIGLESVMVIIAAYALIIAHPGPVFERGVEGPAEKERISAEGKIRQAVGGSSGED